MSYSRSLDGASDARSLGEVLRRALEHSLNTFGGECQPGGDAMHNSAPSWTVPAAISPGNPESAPACRAGFLPHMTGEASSPSGAHNLFPWEYWTGDGKAHVCAWCQAEMRAPKRPGESHGICARHKAQMLADAERINKGRQST